MPEEEKEEESKVTEEKVEEVKPVELGEVGLRNRLCLSMCPGKNMSQGRDGRSYVRDIA